MEFWHRNSILQSPAVQRLGQFVQDWHTRQTDGLPDFEELERELHQHVLAIECELLATELAGYDVTAEQIEMEQVGYRYALTSSETYLSAAGPMTVMRRLYRPAGRGSRSICPLELRAGIVAGHWTPRAARQAAFAMAHLTPGDSEALFKEVGGMQPSRPSLDRLPKELSAHWEIHRQEWEAVLRTQETVPPAAAVMAISVDGVSVRMKGGEHSAKRALPGKHASGPTGHQEAGCGTVVLYDPDGDRLQTVRYGRMPEHRKGTLQEQIQGETAGVLAVRDDLQRVLLADGAEPNWRLLSEVDQACGPAPQPSVEIVDFYHACDHLKEGCDAAWGESTPRSKAEFERLKTLLKEAENGVERVLRLLKYQRDRAVRTKRERLEIQLTYFRNQKQRMHYAEYIRMGFPIASGVMEASCKTLVSQRMKQSGMSWTLSGGQAILTLRSLIQSKRWQPAWNLLRTDFLKTITAWDPHPSPPFPKTPTAKQSPIAFDYAAVPLAT